MIDISHLRNDLEALRSAVFGGKKFECDLNSLVQLDQKRRDAISLAEQARRPKRQQTMKCPSCFKGSAEFLAKVAEMKELAAQVKELEVLAKEADIEFKEIFMAVPNIPHDSVPDGKGGRG